MMVFFRTRLGKILIWQNFLKPESPTLKLLIIFAKRFQPYMLNRVLNTPLWEKDENSRIHQSLTMKICFSFLCLNCLKKALNFPKKLPCCK